MPETIYTQEQYQAIKTAYAQGVTRVKYGDKEIEYRTLAEMKQIISDIEIDLGIKARVSKKYVQHTKGLL